MSDNTRKLLWLTLFAIAMAQVEASLVVHLRKLYYPGDPLAIFPLTLLTGQDLVIELVREVATVIMLISVALLAASGFTRIFAAFVYLFGLWDIFYYVWLKILIDWPVSWGEWDVLYLIPWPWLGPWLTPVVIALLFVVWGGWVLTADRDVRFTPAAGLLFVSGAVLALAAFLLPIFPSLLEGEAAVRGYRPDGFCWLLYVPGVLLMAVALWWVGRSAPGCAD